MLNNLLSELNSESESVKSNRLLLVNPFTSNKKSIVSMFTEAVKTEQVGIDSLRKITKELNDRSLFDIDCVTLENEWTKMNQQELNVLSEKINKLDLINEFNAEYIIKLNKTYQISLRAKIKDFYSKIRHSIEF